MSENSLLARWSCGREAVGRKNAAAAGLTCLLDCFARFALEGRGTPAPVQQTEALVAFGLYRFVEIAVIR